MPITRDIGAGPAVVGAAAEKALVAQRIARLGLSPRQMELNRLYAYYRTQQHDDCTTAWDGSKEPDTITRASIVSTAALPPGYTDTAGELEPLPMRFRRPSVPCQLCRLIVSRFTGLLFGEGQSPAWKVAGDIDTEAWVAAVSVAGGLWSTMLLARNLGGAMGTTIVGFKIIAGHVTFETLDRRWCFPTFDPKSPKELSKLEIRYMFPREERDPETGLWIEQKYWYLRIIDTKSDCVWKPQPVGDGSAEPPWLDPSTVEELREHNLGFVPYVWIQNLEVQDDIDGDPDCLGAYDLFDRVGELDSAIHGGALRNADPTPVVSTDGQLDKVAQGSKYAVKLEKGGSLTYAEMTGTSTKTAAEESDRLANKALQMCECVLADQRDAAGAMTATEVLRRHAAMYSKAGQLRTQYGARGAVLLMAKLIQAAAKLDQGRPTRSGELDDQGHPISTPSVREAIKLPPRADGDDLIQHKLGDTSRVQLTLVWPAYTLPTAQETQLKVTATVAARTGKLITLDTGVRALAADFRIDDCQKEVAELNAEPKPLDMAAQSLAELNQGR